MACQGTIHNHRCLLTRSLSQPHGPKTGPKRTRQLRNICTDMMKEKKNISFVFFLRVWTSNIIRFVAINLRKKSVGSKKFPFDEIYHHSRKCGEIFSLPTPNCTVFRPLKFEQVKQWNPYGYFAAPKYRVVKLNCTTEIEGFYTMLEISFYFQCDLSQTA